MPVEKQDIFCVILSCCFKFIVMGIGLVEWSPFFLYFWIQVVCAGQITVDFYTTSCHSMAGFKNFLFLLRWCKLFMWEQNPKDEHWWYQSTLVGTFLIQFFPQHMSLRSILILTSYILLGLPNVQSLLRGLHIKFCQ